jgi:AcrR family transcriptional regulator
MLLIFIRGYDRGREGLPMVNQTDLRVIRTRKMIKEAFVDLVEEKGYEHITIKDIAEKAFINRKTFYFHFENKTALFNEIIKDPGSPSWQIHSIKKYGQRPPFAY